MIAHGPAVIVLIVLLSGCGPRATHPTEAPMSGDDRATERSAMVTEQLRSRDITDEAVLAAMSTVPRHAFVPKGTQREAYYDSALAIGHDQTISQPYIVALMTQAVGLGPDSVVLEVGTGSGYQAAVCAAITPHVFTIEIVGPLADRAQRTFDELGLDSIVARAGDGYQGWLEHAPFDAILVTAAPDHVPPALFEQLRPGGRLCIPVGDEFAVQHLMLITKGPTGQRIEERISFVRFVPMTGEAEER